MFGTYVVTKYQLNQISSHESLICCKKETGAVKKIAHLHPRFSITKIAKTRNLSLSIGSCKYIAILHVVTLLFTLFKLECPITNWTHSLNWQLLNVVIRLVILVVLLPRLLQPNPDNDDM